MKRKVMLGLLFFSLLAALFYFYPLAFDWYEQQQKVKYVKEWNDYLINRMKDDEKQRSRMSAADKKRKDEKFDRFAKIVSARSVDIDFYGKVIDQEGLPVQGVIVEYAGTSGYLTKGSGHAKTQTDQTGLFHITNSNGTSLKIVSMHKIGFDIKMKSGGKGIVFDSHQRFEDSKQFQSYSSSTTPFIFKAWKKQGKKNNSINYGSSKSFHLNKEYWVDFLSKSVPTISEQPNSLKLQFSKQDDVVSLDFNMVGGGGLLETKRSHYMKVAPESGYLNNYHYEFDAREASGLSVIKYFYFRTGLAGSYGKVKMTIMPNYKSHSRGYISFVYQTNLDDTRILEN